MYLCTYIVKKDTGFAPNPFWGWCTLAACTPNHMNADLNIGDWIAGFLAGNRSHRLLYVMKISDVLHFNDYFQDSRFQQKKPNLRGNWKERCGDSIYFQDGNNRWRRSKNLYHTSEALFTQDIKHPKVFIGSHFWYFGKNAIEIPHEFNVLIWKRQGVKKNHDSLLVEQFSKWIAENYKTGIHAVPIDNPDLLKDLDGSGNILDQCK